ncbi:SIMPL domain-containing protein [Rhizobium mesoamericanum]|uniref:26 kDa periplasmic immunogenic protein n=1 Tax=Rhizobium mesoamericanum STM3625 TaxID=1211777 RepID=K0PKA3_9HYPH|nr:26 kDa periplasmic immunogenic protein [Rhizobium mesoamericanum STM3625]
MLPNTRTIAFSLLLGLPAATAMGLPALAADSQQREAAISVSGEGQASVAPDMAVLNLSVVKQAKTAREALDENNKAMSDVLAALKKAGIAERDLQTSGFSVQPQFNFPQSNDGQQQPPQLVGYQVSNSLSVRVRDLSKLGAILDEAVTLGVNQGGDIQFTNDKPQAAMEEARKNAVADAIKKAKTLAAAADVKIGRVIEISETSPRPQPVPVLRAAMMKEAADSAVPIQGGETSYNVTVNVTFSIAQ